MIFVVADGLGCAHPIVNMKVVSGFCIYVYDWYCVIYTYALCYLFL